MILICPACQARFNIPAGAIKAAGRKVRCASCLHTWRAVPDELRENSQSAQTPIQASGQPAVPQGMSEPAAKPSQPIQSAAPVSAADALSSGDVPEDYGSHGAGAALEDDQTADQTDDTVIEPSASASSPDDFMANLENKLDNIGIDKGDLESDFSDDDFLAARRADQRRQHQAVITRRRRRVVVMGWGLLILFWLVIGGLFLGMGDYVQEKWPASRAIYDSFSGANQVDQFKKEAAEAGEALSPSVIDAPTVLQALLEGSKVEDRDGKRTLVINGYVENQGRRAANVPKVRAQIVDGRGRTLDTWVFDPPGLVLSKGTKLRFETTRYPIPAGAASAVVSVVDNSKSATEAESR